MKLALVGVGGAGGRIVNQIRKWEHRTNRTLSDGNVLVFDTTDSAGSLDAIPRDQCIVLGDTHRGVNSEGVDGDADLAAEITREELHDVRRIFDFVSAHELDAFLLVAGLGGGTGSGTGAVLLEELQATYENPVYALGVLPEADEGAPPALNAARSLRSFVPEADNVLLSDNDASHSSAVSSRGGDGDTDGDEDRYEPTNRDLATRVTSLFATGQRDRSQVAETAVDSSDIVRTLETGGVTSLGYASVELDRGRGRVLSWLSRLFGLDGEWEMVDPTVIERLVRQAVTTGLTLPCEISSAERTLIVLSGPPSAMSRRGFESARRWLEEETETVETRAGDDPDRQSRNLTATVVLSNVTDVPRIDAIQDRAVAARDGVSD